MKFIYSGPLSVSTLYTTEGGKRVPLKVRFAEGEEVDVPAEHPLVRSLIARGRLTPVEETESPRPKRFAGATKKTSSTSVPEGSELAATPNSQENDK